MADLPDDDHVQQKGAARAYAQAYADQSRGESAAMTPPDNALWEHFQSHKKGKGIWKWEHYFDIYQRHFAKFTGKHVNLLEVGIYSGGSLEMWRSYLGENCHIYGVDIEEACRAYDSDHVSVFIGDQEDRSFWRDLRTRVQGIDILIDDGGHSPEQQRVTLEEMLPFIRPGGVYLCEDVHGRTDPFAAYATALAEELNAKKTLRGPELASAVTPFQAAVHSIHFYPYVIVIEKNHAPPSRFAAPRHGTEWQPFL